MIVTTFSIIIRNKKMVYSKSRKKGLQISKKKSNTAVQISRLKFQIGTPITFFIKL